MTAQIIGMNGHATVIPKPPGEVETVARAICKLDPMGQRLSADALVTGSDGKPCPLWQVFEPWARKAVEAHNAWLAAQTKIIDA